MRLCDDESRRDDDLVRAVELRPEEPVRLDDAEVRLAPVGGLVLAPSRRPVAEEDMRRELASPLPLDRIREDVPTCDVEYRRLAVVFDDFVSDGEVYLSLDWLERRRELPVMLLDVRTPDVRDDVRDDFLGRVMAVGCGCSDDLRAAREEALVEAYLLLEDVVYLEPMEERASADVPLVDLPVRADVRDRVAAVPDLEDALVPLLRGRA